MTPTVEKPLVSVIVPVYKVEAYLDKCLESILGQTYENLEVILVDDGSPDRCPEICDEWAGRSATWTVLHLKNGGLSSARNAGLSCAKGDFILFVDSDDWLDERLVESCVGSIASSGADVVMYRFDRVSDMGEIVGEDPLPAFPHDSSCHTFKALRHLLLGHVQSYAWAFLARRAIYEGGSPLRFPVGALMEDVSTTYKVLLRAGCVGFIDEVYYHYRVRPGSTLENITLKLIDDVYSSAIGRAAGVRESFPQLELEVEVSLATSLLSGLLSLGEIRNQIEREDYASRRSAYVGEIRKLSFRDMSPLLTKRERVLISLVDIGLCAPMLGLRSAVRRMRVLRR